MRANADGVLEALQEALLEELQIEAAYQRLDGEEPKNLRIHPLGLVLRGAITYLVATVFDYQDIRLLAVHRIKQAKKLDARAHRPERFSLDDYIGGGGLHFGVGKSIHLVANASASLADILIETPLSHDQRLTKEGDDYLLRARLNDTWQLRWWILSHGASLTVLKPERLRKEIAATLEQAAKKYSNAP